MTLYHLKDCPKLSPPNQQAVNPIPCLLGGLLASNPKRTIGKEVRLLGRTGSRWNKADRVPKTDTYAGLQAGQQGTLSCFLPLSVV